MKLFTPTEVINSKENQLAAVHSRTISLDKELTRKRNELEKLNLQFEITLTKQRESFDKEKNENYTLINSLKAEIKDLLKKRELELVPLSEKWKEVEKADKLLRKKQSIAIQQIEEFNDKLELLEDNLTLVAERENAVTTIEQKQQIAQEGINEQKELISKKQKSFNEQVANSIIEFRVKEKELATRESELDLKLKYIKTLENKINEKEKGFINREKHIESQQQALKIAFQELENKQYGVKKG